MHEQLRSALAEIEQVLEAERIALRSLDLPAIEAATAKKQELEARLRACAISGETLNKEEREVLKRIREAAQANQLLLVHARACVRGAVALATGQQAEPYSQTNAAPPTALRLNVKG